MTSEQKEIAQKYFWWLQNNCFSDDVVSLNLRNFHENVNQRYRQMLENAGIGHLTKRIEKAAERSAVNEQDRKIAKEGLPW